MAAVLVVLNLSLQVQVAMDCIPDFVGGEEDPRRRNHHGRDEQRGGLLDEREGFAPPEIRR